MEETTSNTKGYGLKALLKIANFRYLWFGQIVSDLGDSMTNLALLLLVNDMTGSIAALATMAIILALPNLTVGLVAGVIIDRIDRKRLMMLSDCLRGIFVLGFILVYFSNKIWILYLLGFIQSSIATFFNPARSALVPNLIPKEALLSANSISQVSRIIFGLLGTGLAGFVIGQGRQYWQIFAIDAITFYISFMLISLIHHTHQERENMPSITARHVLSELGEGLKLTFSNRMLLGAVVAFAITMLGLGAVNILMVPLIVNDLKVSETWFAGIEFSQTAGLILSGTMVATLSARLKPTSILTLGIILLGIDVAFLSRAVSVWNILLILFFAGAFVAPVQAAGATIIQTLVPDKVRGRTGSASNAVITSSQLISMGLAGALADLVGVRSVFVFGGVMVSLAGFAAWMIFRGITYEDSGEQPASISGGN